VFDVLALHRLGIKNCISFSNIRISKYQYKLIKDKECLFIYDGDKGGETGIEYIEKTYKNPLFQYKLLTSEKDLDEISKEEVFSVIDEGFLL